MVRLHCQTAICKVGETNIPDPSTNPTFTAFGLIVLIEFAKLLPLRFREPAIWSLGTAAILWLAWCARTGRLPSLRIGPGKSALRKTLIVGLILTPVSILWLAGFLFVAGKIPFQIPVMP